MKALPIMIACLPLLQSCATTQTTAFEIERNVVEKVDKANCSQLAENMNLALVSMDSAKKQAQFGETAQWSSTAAMLVAPAALFLGPFGMVLPAAASAIGGFAFADGTMDQIEPEMLYRASHNAYSTKGCSPRVAFGQAAPGSRTSTVRYINKSAFSTQTVELQQQLNARGYDAGVADGVMGPRTREALIQFQKANGLSQSGKPDSDTLSVMGL